MKIKNPYALINDELVHVCDERITSGSGELYICPDKLCKEPIYARKGKLKVHHFAHKSGVNCNGLESALHLKAKEIIENVNTIIIPKYRIWAGGILRRFQNEIFKIEREFKYPLYSKGFVNFWWENIFDYDQFCLFQDISLNLEDYRIESEVLLEGLKPDIKLINRKTGKSLYIEIAVTSFVKDDKKKLIKEQDLSVLEIDLSSFYKSEEYSSINSKELEDFLKITFTEGQNIKSESTFYNRRPSYNWINLNDENKLVDNRKDKFVEIWKDKLKVFYKFYCEKFIPYIDDYKNVLEFKSNKEIVNELFIWDDEYRKIENVLMTDHMINHFLKMYKTTDLFKMRNNKNLEERESVEDFIKRMTT